MVRQTFQLLSSFSRFYISRSRGFLANSCISSTFRYKLNINSAYLSTNRRQKKLTPIVLNISSPHETEIKKILDDLDKSKIKEAGESLKELLTIDTFISDVQSVNLIFQSYCNVSGPEEGEKLLNTLITDHSFQPDIVSYTTLMSAYSHKGDYLACVRLMDEMKSKQIQPDLSTHTSMITAYIKASLPSEAEKILRDLITGDEIVLDIALFNSLINGYILKKQPLEAFRIFQEMIKPSIPPDESTYKILFSALAPDYPRESEKLLFYWKQNPNNFTPDLLLCTKIVNGYCSAIGLEEGERFFHTLITDYSIQPDAFLYTTLMSVYSQKADYLACVRLMEEMKSKFIQPDLFSYTALITAYSKGSLPSEGEKILRDLITSGEVILTIAPYHAVINGYILTKQPLEAYRIYQELVKTSIPPDDITLITLIYELAPEHPKESEEILLQWKRNPVEFDPDVKLINYVLQSYCQATGPEEGERFLNNLIQVHEFQPNSISYTTLMSAYSHKGDYLACLRLITEMKSKKIKPDRVSYTSLIMAYTNASLPSEAEKVLRYLITGGKIALTVVPYNAVIGGYLEMNQPLKAYYIFQELIKTSIPPSKVTYGTLLHGLASDYSRECEEILLHWKQNPEEYSPDLSLMNKILNGYCKNIGPKMGERFFKDFIIKLFTPDFFSYNTLMTSYSRRGDYQSCSRLMNDMKSKQIQPSIVSYLSLIKAYSKASLPAEGEKVLRDLLTRNDIVLTIAPYHAAINGYIESKEPLEAYRLFQELIKTSIPPDNATYKTLLFGLSRNHPVEAEKVLAHKNRRTNQNR